LISFITGGAGIVYITMQTERDDSKLPSIILTLYGLIGLAASLAVIFLPHSFIKIVASTASQEVISVATDLLRYMAFATLPMMLATILASHLQIKC
jgi:Na+-driven multidrug efflux pump